MEISIDQPTEHLGNICGAKNRSGGICQNPPVNGKRRCHNHGGAPGSGPPLGNKNALKHGIFSAAAISERLSLQAYLKEMQDMVKGFSSYEDMVNKKLSGCIST